MMKNYKFNYLCLRNSNISIKMISNPNSYLHKYRSDLSFTSFNFRLSGSICGGAKPTPVMKKIN